MTVELLSLCARNGEEIAVTFLLRQGEYTQKETFLVSAALVADLRLQTGESTQDCYDSVAYGAEVYQAVCKGLYLLGYGSCSARTLCRKLTEKGIRKEIAAEAVKELARQGYLNGHADALREAERCVAKRWGRRRIAAALFAKGYADGDVRSALTRLEEEVDYVRLCVERIRRQIGTVPTDAAGRRKLTVALQRYGFTGSEIREAFRLTEDETEDDI